MPQWIASPRFHSGLHDPHSGHMHPLKYCLGLGRAAASLGVRIFENSPVVALEPGASASTPVRVRTAQGEVTARHVLLAGNVYLQGLAPQLEKRIMPVGTYIVTSTPLDPELVTIADPLALGSVRHEFRARLLPHDATTTASCTAAASATARARRATWRRACRRA